MNRLVSWLVGVGAWLRERWRSAGSAGFVAVAVVGLLVAMFLADGFRATSYELNNSGVWVTKQKLLGRFNTQAVALDSVVSSELDHVDVAQDGDAVAVFGGDQLQGVDPASVTLSKALKLPGGGHVFVEMSGGRYVVADGKGRVWSGPSDQIGVWDPGRRPDLKGVAVTTGGNPLVTVGRDGTVAAVVGAKGGDGPVVRVRRSSGEVEDVDLDGLPTDPSGLQLALVGSTPVVLDTAARKLMVPGASPVDLSRAGEAPALQISGDESGDVTIGTSQGLVSVPLKGGSPRVVKHLTGASGAIRPAVVNGCVYGAWGGAGPHMVVTCASGGTVEQSLDGVSGPLRFRVNRSNVALNDIESGTVFVRVGDRIKRVAGDWEPEETPNGHTTTTNPDPKVQGIDLESDPKPPVAEPDKGGARRGRPSVISVLDNDRDPNGDLLTVHLQADQPAGAVVSVVNEGRAVQVTPGADGPDHVTFTYKAFDGRFESNVATVTVAVYDNTHNEAPHRKDVAQRDFKVGMQQSGTYDVLSDWEDPEGDPIVLAGARPEDPTTSEAHTVPTGRLTYLPTGGVPGIRKVTVEVSDLPPSGASLTGSDSSFSVTVVGRDEQLPPVLQPDFVVGTAGSPITVFPLRNDSDPTGQPLMLVKTVKPSDWPACAGEPELSVDDARLVLHPDATCAGKSLVFGYEATNGYKSAQALIRVDVRPPDGNHPPSPGVDVVLLPPGQEPRTVDLLVNDFDPDGDVMMVTGVSPNPALSTQLLEHRRLRVWASATLGQPVLLSYTVTDGMNAATGFVVVAQSPLAAQNAPPVTAPDTATVRVGDVVSIPVLANDLDPDGDPMRLGTDLAQGPGPGQGTAFVSGNVVRFVAPDAPGTVHLTYRVTDSSDDSAPRPWVTEDVTVTVVAREENRAPVPQTVEARVLAGSTTKVVIPLSGIDPDGDSVNLSGVMSSDPPTRGRIVMPLGTDSITYEAFPLAADTTGGADHFSYRVTDARGASATGLVRVVVGAQGSSSPPVARKDTVRVAPGATAVVPVLANDYDPDGDPIRLAEPALGPIPDGVDAKVVGQRIQVTAPNDVRAVTPLTYYITDGRTVPPAPGTIQIIVDPDAPGLPPIAHDDVARPKVGQKDVTSFSVDVRANDEDPDGDPQELHVSVLSGPGTEDKGEVVVKPGSRPQVVVYKVTDNQNLSSTAVVEVPSKAELADLPPVLNDKAPVVTVKVGGSKQIDLSTYVIDPEGQHVQLTQGNLVRFTPPNVAQPTDVKPDAFTIAVSDAAQPGPAAVMFEVTDAADTNLGNKVTLSIPFTVVPASGQLPPKLRDGLAVTAGVGDGPVTLDLADQLDSAAGPTEGVTFATDTSAPKGLDVALKPSGQLTVNATKDAQPGTTLDLAVKVTRGSESSDAKVGVSVVQTTKPPPVCSDAEITDAKAGESSTVQVACTNPFPDDQLTFGQPTSDTPKVTARVDQGSVTVTPAKGFVGQAVVTYPVTDAAKRTVNGVVRVNVRDVPGTPGAPIVVSEASEQVVLRWSAPDPHGAEITKYLVEAPQMTRPFECAATSTTCTITNLTNDVSYTFGVRAVNEVGPGDLGPTATARPDQKPEPPTNVTLTFDKTRLDGKLTARWTASQTKGSKVDKYTVKVIPPVDGAPPSIDVTSGTELQLDGLTNGTPYRVEVRAVNKSLEGSSDPTESNTETPAKAPDPVKTPTVGPVSDPLGMRINVSWSAPVNGGAAVTGYQVNVYKDGQCNPTSTPAKALPTVPPDQKMPYVIDLGDKYNDYQVAVLAITKATDEKGNPSGSLTPFNCSAKVRAPSKPAPVGTINVIPSQPDGRTGLNGQLKLTFTAPDAGGSPISGYQVSQNGGPYVKVSAANTQVSGNQVTLTMTGLANGATYNYRIQALNGTSFPSDESGQVSGRPYAPLQQPGISVIGADQGGVTFRITAPPDSGRGPVSVNPGGDVRVGGGCGSVVSISVTATDTVGQTSTASASGSTAACPSVTVAWGSSATVTGCTSGCKRMVGTVANFPPSQSFPVSCQYRTSATGPWLSDFGWTPGNLTTDGAGNGSTGEGDNCVGQPGSGWQYRLVINGVVGNAVG